jgi:hypothetical protein
MRRLPSASAAAKAEFAGLFPKPRAGSGQALHIESLAPAAARPRVFLAPLLRFAPKRSWQCGFVRGKHRRLAGASDKSAATRGKAPKARKARLSQSFHGTSHRLRLFMFMRLKHPVEPKWKEKTMFKGPSC